MARRKRQPEEPIDFSERQRCRFPWDDYSPEQLEALEAAHDRAKCLIAKGYGGVRWDRYCGTSTGSLFDDAA